MMIRRRRHLLTLLSAFWVMTSTSLLVADQLPSPSGDVVLRVSGGIEVTNSEDGAEFDLAMLRALDSHEIETTTIWTDGDQTFVGVELGTLLKYLKASGSIISAYAINDYFIELPFEDAEPGAALIAYERNGVEMSVRDKGPLWIVYPYDHSERFRTEVFFSRSVWQLDRLIIER
ncbi:MAG: oxidoreductase [Pelagimonas sp.]|uniref:oxidoreductase n=1 Tax=Pelagimonas sp. TaxID=2073170 RepID=UPI003D6C6693